MTRFDADSPKERRKLFAEAVTAHRTRASPFLTVEVEHDPDVDGEDSPAPWVQFADQTFNMDVTEEELECAKSLLSEFPEFRIDQMESPEEAEGTNLRIIARSDANRLAAFVDRVFTDVYGRDEDYCAWVAAV
ncbi:hypothetical protein C499_02107 [Halogeometricum borinquense DSM 11551]|uniref:DUF7975 domain-containing protein n=2 Tax=Halogeometricum borinquense TaxID=60847 RepID=E4NPF7_HALBP|nr:hypothetical protein [Halogeometricum borinquense]ADQ66512.1 hypothetical protein Hbor_09170 [Halogeometricum borinquense DSM 11551]ELY30987.1 hypothetical protein C499_02107 [Halogeometricum borinquense DSM 11551]RYJ14375.1 hypothetical protein ELS19_10705 [Halogeometricum borinquense]